MSKIKNGGLDQYGKVYNLNGIGGVNTQVPMVFKISHTDSGVLPVDHCHLHWTLFYPEFDVYQLKSEEDIWEHDRNFFTKSCDSVQRHSCIVSVYLLLV